MGYSKHEYTTINMLYSPRKFVDITPLPPHIGHLSTMATFLCPQGGLYGRFDCIYCYSLDPQALLFC